MGKEQCSSYCIFKSSREGYWRSLKKNKKIKFFLYKAETGLEELVLRHPFGVATWLRVGLSLVGREVATRKWCRDLVCFG